MTPYQEDMIILAVCLTLIALAHNLARKIDHKTPLGGSNAKTTAVYSSP